MSDNPKSIVKTHIKLTPISNKNVVAISAADSFVAEINDNPVPGYKLYVSITGEPAPAQTTSGNSYFVAAGNKPIDIERLMKYMSDNMSDDYPRCHLKQETSHSFSIFVPQAPTVKAPGFQKMVTDTAYYAVREPSVHASSSVRGF